MTVCSKTKSFFFLLVVFTAFASCKKNDSAKAEQLVVTQPVVEIHSAEEHEVKTPQADAAPVAVDIDLTRMNANMVYAEVFNMLIEPEFYEGKSVRMAGKMYIPQQIEGAPRYACIVQDATACCSAGLGFSFADESPLVHIPDDGEFITVRGTYTCQEEDGFSTIILIDCTLES